MATKDKSGFTPQERHQIIVNYLKEIDKPTKVFHLRWKPGDLLNGKVLESTPMFWYMKYGWTRMEIETMFYKARCVIGPLFDMALQQTFGGDPGPRWRGAVPERPTQKWRQRQQEKTEGWQAEQAEKLKQKEEEERRRKMEAAKRRAELDRKRKEEAAKLSSKSKDIWNAVSDYGADKYIDYKMFSENLRDRGINVSPLLAKQLFDQIAGPNGKISKQEMEDLLRKLDGMDAAATITLDMLGNKLGCMTIMKRILVAAAAGEPFNVDDFVFAQKMTFNIEGIQFMNKLTDRDVPWDDRVRAMEQLSANLGTNPMFNNVLAKQNIPELLCGWATQLLDPKPEVQKTAIDLLPGIFHNAKEFGDADLAVGHLEEILDNLFKILDDPNATRNHPAAKDAIEKLVQDVLDTADPESVLFLSGLLAEKTDSANVNNPDARKFALVQLQKIMFGPNSPYTEFDDKQKEAPKVEQNKLPQKGSVHREWLDIGTNNKAGPGMDDIGANLSNHPHKNPPKSQSHETLSALPPRSGGVDEDAYYAMDESPDGISKSRKDPNSGGDIANKPKRYKRLRGREKEIMVRFPNRDPRMYIDSESRDQKGRVYPDNQKRDDEKYDPESGSGPEESFSSLPPPDPSNPYAHLSSTPTVPQTNDPVTIDASKSHDADKEPCVSYIFDFGDGSPPVTSKNPVVKHSYKYPGSYPVSVSVTDKYGKTGNAHLTQRVVEPQAVSSMGPPYAQLTSNPTESTVRQPTYFDASNSHDFKNAQCEHFVFDFGDGSKLLHSKTPKVVYRYQNRGVYNVTVTAQDKYGQSATAGLDQRVIDPTMTDPGNPSAHLASTPLQAKTKDAVTFDASKSRDYAGNKVKKYVFEFGDGTKPQTAFKPVVTHSFTKGGTFPVTVTVTDKFGKKASAQISQRIKDPFNPTQKGSPHVAVDNNPMEAEIEEPVTFDASKSHDYLGKPCDRYTWDFGDNSPKKVSTTPIVQHSYRGSGSYPVTVQATDQWGQSGTATCTQRVEPPMPSYSKSSAEKVDANGPSPDDPYVAVHSTPEDPKPDEPVRFDASPSHDANGDPCKLFTWDFGDGSPPKTTNTPIVNHVFDKPGAFPVKCTVTDSSGRKGTGTLQQNVADPDPSKSPDESPSMPPFVAIKSSPTEAVPNQPVRLDASDCHDKDGGPCKTFTWDFGDGSPPKTTDSPFIEYPFDKPGAFPVSVTVTDKDGNKGSATLNQRVRDPNPDDPYASVTSTPSDAKPTDPVTIDASRSVDKDGNPCTNFVYDFGDGSPPLTTTDPVVTHTFDRPGSFPVTVTVTDKDGNRANATLTQKVDDDPLNPFDFSSYELDDPEPRKGGKGAMNSKLGPKRYPLNRRNDTDQKEDAPSGGYQLGSPYAAVQSFPMEVAPNQMMTCDASKSVDSKGNPCTQFVWDFGDGSPKQTTKEAVTTHEYKDPGTYPISVDVTDSDGLTARAQCSQRVRAPSPEDPFAHISSEPQFGDPKKPVTIDASQSHDKDGDPCTKFVWDLGDGSPLQTTTDPVLKKTFDRPGSYPVSCTVIDKYGNKSNAHTTQHIKDPNNPKEKLPPYAHVESTPTDAAPKDPVTFDATKSRDKDQKPCTNFVFDFGDGSTPTKSTNPVVQHPFTKPGVYPVTVTVTDKDGLQSQATMTQRVSDPTLSDDDPSKGNKGPKSRNYGGRKGQAPPSENDPNVQQPFGSKGGNQRPGYESEMKSEGMDPKEIGDEFRSITHEALSHGIMDPNKKNNTDAKKMADVMKQLDPNYAKGLDPEAKKQYLKWSKKPMKPVKPYAKKLPAKPLPNPGQARVHAVQTEVNFTVSKPFMPDI